jgi:hypothetical protein
MRGIVVGTGRSGTGYVHKVLCEAGVHCGHEQVFTPNGAVNPAPLEMDSSWMAVPYLSAHPGTPVILVHRHPLAVISSFLGIGFFDDDGQTEHSQYRKFLYAKNPRLKGMSPWDAACEHYCDWNEKALRYATLVTELDDLDWAGICKEIDLDYTLTAAAIPNVSQTHNHRPRANVDPNLVPARVWETRAELMEASS